MFLTSSFSLCTLVVAAPQVPPDVSCRIRVQAAYTAFELLETLDQLREAFKQQVTQRTRRERENKDEKSAGKVETHHVLAVLLLPFAGVASSSSAGDRQLGRRGRSCERRATARLPSPHLGHAIHQSIGQRLSHRNHGTTNQRGNASEGHLFLSRPCSLTLLCCCRCCCLC